MGDAVDELIEEVLVDAYGEDEDRTSAFGIAASFDPRDCIAKLAASLHGRFPSSSGTQSACSSVIGILPVGPRLPLSPAGVITGRRVA